MPGMNPAVLQALMGGVPLKDFIQERGAAIKDIGRRPRAALTTVVVDGHQHTPLYPDRAQQSRSQARRDTADSE